jgi:hypothetical protein
MPLRLVLASLAIVAIFAHPAHAETIKVADFEGAVLPSW